MVLRKTVLLALCVVAPLLARAGEPGSGIYAADCTRPEDGVAVDLSPDGSAAVTAQGEVHADLRTAYAPYAEATPADFHLAILFEPGRSPWSETDGQPGRLEIWKGEAAFYALPDGEAARRLLFCAELAETAEPRPSFPCDKAEGSVEELICADGALARQDWALAATFRKAVGRLASDEAQVERLKAEQRGWIEGRNECWKESDARACVAASYSDRHATLLARYGLAEAGQTQVWACGEGSETLYVTPFMTEPATINLVMGDEATTAIQRRAASGVRYEAPFGVEFWEKGKTATLRWPQDTRTACRHQGPLGE